MATTPITSQPTPAAAPTQALTTFLEWEAYEFPYWKKSREWYIAIGIFSCSLLAMSILTGNFLLGVMAPLIFFLLMIYGAKRPRRLHYAITSLGVKIGNRFWRFNELNSFWILYEPEVKEILIANKALLTPKLTLPLDDQDPNELRRLFMKFLPEKQHEESLVDIFMRRLKF